MLCVSLVSLLGLIKWRDDILIYPVVVDVLITGRLVIWIHYHFHLIDEDVVLRAIEVLLQLLILVLQKLVLVVQLIQHVFDV